MTRRGHSLVEVLVVILITGILTAILVPVIRTARESARSAQDLSNLRQTMLDFFSYATDHKDEIANAGSPFDESSRFFYHELWGRFEAYPARYFAQESQWTSVLSQSIEAGVHWHSSYEDFILEGGPGEPWSPLPAVSVEQAAADWPSRYALTPTLLTEWDVWKNPAVRMPDEEFFSTKCRRVHFAEVASPSRKAVLSHINWPGESRGLRHIAFADGSVALKLLADGQPAAVHPRSVLPTRVGTPGRCTLDGYLGVDF